MAARQRDRTVSAAPAAAGWPGNGDPTLATIAAMDDAHTEPTNRRPGVYLSDPHGHALVVGTNGRALTVLDTGGVVEIAGVHVTSAEPLEQLADRLVMLAGRMRSRAAAAADRARCAGQT